MYEPIHLLIDRHPKLPPECQQFDVDIMKNPDITEEEVNSIIANIMSENFAKFLSIRHTLHMHIVTLKRVKPGKRGILMPTIKLQLN